LNLLITRIVFFGFALPCLTLLAGVTAQESLNGELAEVSYGEISVSLEITNRPNPTLTLINRGNGNTAIPAFVAEALTKALSNSNNASFPVCLLVTSNQEVTVSVVSSVNEQYLTGDDGSRMPFALKLNGNDKGSNNGNGQSTKYKPNDNLSCSEDSALDVEITLGESLAKTGSSVSANGINKPTAYRGSFKLLIRAE
jgi:hypothetical protein